MPLWNPHFRIKIYYNVQWSTTKNHRSPTSQQQALKSFLVSKKTCTKSLGISQEILAAVTLPERRQCTIMYPEWFAASNTTAENICRAQADSWPFQPDFHWICSGVWQVLNQKSVPTYLMPGAQLSKWNYFIKAGLRIWDPDIKYIAGTLEISWGFLDFPQLKHNYLRELRQPSAARGSVRVWSPASQQSSPWRWRKEVLCRHVAYVVMCG